MAFLYSLDNSVAAQSSSRGMVSFFSGATFDMERRSSQYNLIVIFCGAHVEAGSISSFTAVTKSTYLYVDSIGGDNLPFYLEL